MLLFTSFPDGCPFFWPTGAAAALLHFSNFCCFVITGIFATLYRQNKTTADDSSRRHEVVEYELL